MRLNVFSVCVQNLSFFVIVPRQIQSCGFWGVQKMELEHWPEQQPGPQLVFVRYSPKARGPISYFTLTHPRIRSLANRSANNS